jgi:hypothetical protein
MRSVVGFHPFWIVKVHIREVRQCSRLVATSVIEMWEMTVGEFCYFKRFGQFGESHWQDVDGVYAFYFTGGHPDRHDFGSIQNDLGKNTIVV